MHGELISEIELMTKQIIERMSAELVEMNVRRRDNTAVVDIIADKIGGGITIDECTRINKQVVRLIEEKQWFGDDFIVEVASPGLDRKLKTEKDFIRIKGKKVRVHLLSPIEGKLEHHGEIAEVKKSEVQINSKKQTITIPLSVISKAVQEIE